GPDPDQTPLRPTRPSPCTPSVGTVPTPAKPPTPHPDPRPALRQRPPTDAAVRSDEAAPTRTSRRARTRHQTQINRSSRAPYVKVISFQILRSGGSYAGRASSWPGAPWSG